MTRRLLLPLCLLSCTGEEKSPATSAVEVAPAGPVQPTALVPPPAQVQQALEQAGITADVQNIVGSRVIRATAESKDETAVRTGVLLAHVVLTVRTAPRAESQARLAAVRAGLVSLGVIGTAPLGSLDQLRAGLANDAVNESDRSIAMDHLSQIIVTQTYSAGPRTVPLLQAGGWLAGTQVVAAALLASGKIEAASLMKQPEVANYFLGFVQGEGQRADLPPVMAKVEATLRLLQALAEKSEISPEDVQQTQIMTGDLLSLL